MFDWIFSVMQRMFQLFFDFMNSIQLRENVSLWSLFLVFLIGGSIATAVVRIIGNGGLASSISSTVNSAHMDNYKNKPDNKSKKGD